MKILVVDDNEVVRTCLCMALNTIGHEAVPAGGLVQARELLEKVMALDPAERFAGVLSDLSMDHEKAGLELQKEVRVRFPTVWTILISGGFPPGVENEAAEAHILCLDKPVSRGTLKWAIDFVSAELVSAVPVASQAS